MSGGIPWSTVRLAVRNWVVAGAAPEIDAAHVIWTGQQHSVPAGLYVTLDITGESDFGYDRNDLTVDGAGVVTEHVIGDRIVTLRVTVYGGIGNTTDATLTWRILSRIRAASGLSNVGDALAAANVGIMSWGKITTPGRGLNPAVFEPRAMFDVELAVVSDVVVTGAAAGGVITTVNADGTVDTTRHVIIHQTIE